MTIINSLIIIGDTTMKYIKLVVRKIDSKEATRRINANTFLKGNIDCEGVNDNNQLEWVQVILLI